MNGKNNQLNGLLSLEDISKLFKIPSVTLQRWVYQGKIPFKLINSNYFFKKSTIFKWAKMHDFTIEDNRKNTNEKKTDTNLSDAITKGGIYFNIQGHNIYKVFENSLERLNFFEEEKKIDILNQLINREEIASTSLGNGIAIPHIRNKFDLNLEEARIPVFFLQNEIDFNAIDGKPVSVLFMMFTTSPAIHLKMLSKISLFIQREFPFNINADSGKFIDKIKSFEKSLSKN